MFLEHFINSFLPVVIHTLELMGIIIITIASVKAFYSYIKTLFTGEKYSVKYELGDALATGLEFKLGAEILKTVLIRNIEEIWILAAIILLRALLAFIIHMEIKAEKHTN